MRLINYMVTMKKNKLAHDLQRLTLRHKIVIAMAFFLGIITVSESFINLAYKLEKYYVDRQVLEDMHIFFIRGIQRNIVRPLTDMVMGLAVVYLFYSMGMSKIQGTNPNKESKNMHEELGLDIDLSTEGGSDSYRDVGQEANAHYTSSHPENFTSINTDSVPIINSLQHFVDNFHKINSFDDKNEKRKSSLVKRAETKDLKLYMLEQIM
jgi:hypothetical protein